MQAVENRFQISHAQELLCDPNSFLLACKPGELQNFALVFIIEVKFCAIAQQELNQGNVYQIEAEPDNLPAYIICLNLAFKCLHEWAHVSL